MIDPALEFPNDRDYNLGVPWVKSGYWNKNMQGRERVRAPESLRDLDAEIAGLLLAASADITLVIDAEGFIRDIATGDQFSDKNLETLDWPPVDRNRNSGKPHHD